MTLKNKEKGKKLQIKKRTLRDLKTEPMKGKQVKGGSMSGTKYCPTVATGD